MRPTREQPAEPDGDCSDVQRQRAEGRYELVIEDELDGSAAWAALRRALRLPRGDLDWLRARTPGPVRRGARQDLVPVLERLLERGYTASIRRRPSQAGSPGADGGEST